jgi:glycine dehydrogenase subunit 2
LITVIIADHLLPLIVPEAIMIEPTETERKETLDTFCDA